MVLLVGWSLRKAAALQDDFVYLAVARHLDNPLLLLTQDSIGSYFFRPVVMLVWWVSAAVFGESVAAHSALGLAVHLGNGGLLYVLLRRLGMRDTVAGVAALLFVAHPASIATACWLSARFDLFAAFFGLAALIAVERYLIRPGIGGLLAVLVAMLASILSKEIGFAIAATGMLMAVWPQPDRHTATWRSRWLLVAVIASCALLAFAARTQVLRPVPDSGGLWRILPGIIANGTWNWLRSLPGMLVVAEGRAIAALIWAATLVALAALAVTPRTLAQWKTAEMVRGICIAVALMLLCAIVQSPTTHGITIATFSREAFDALAAVSARFYYVALLGFAVLAATAAEGALRAGISLRLTIAMVALVLASALCLTAVSRGIARQWAHFTTTRIELYARPAIEAVTGLQGLTPGCKIYLLDTPAPADLFRDMMDTGVKKSLPRGHPALACFIQAEHTPWYHLLENRALGPGAEKPLEIIHAAGAPYLPLDVGNLTYYFVRIAPNAAIANDARAMFLAWRDGRFIDVTEEVRTGRKQPRFHDRRAP